jgi:formylglycine-generating enzyme required for sulfatase activity
MRNLLSCSTPALLAAWVASCGLFLEDFGGPGEACYPDSTPCEPGLVCNSSTNRCCLPFCGSRECGDDGCGGSCGVCPPGQACLGTCQPLLEWVSLPGGTYMMGRPSGFTNERCGYSSSHTPEHSVSVPGFFITRTEITVAQYRVCVEAGACLPPAGVGPQCNYPLSGRDLYPANCVDWPQARGFCTWAGGRLASEAEWEYAGSNLGDGGTYPWEPACTRESSGSASCQYAVYREDYQQPHGCGLDTTWPVCSKPAGNTQQGLCDMAGNVSEWVEDLWHGLSTGYTGAPTDGTAWVTGTDEVRRVTRGGSFRDSSAGIYVFARGFNAPMESSETDQLGIRCVYR